MSRPFGALRVEASTPLLPDLEPVPVKGPDALDARLRSIEEGLNAAGALPSPETGRARFIRRARFCLVCAGLAIIIGGVAGTLSTLSAIL